jgi:hypothetical protein
MHDQYLAGRGRDTRYGVIFELIEGADEQRDLRRHEVRTPGLATSRRELTRVAASRDRGRPNARAGLSPARVWTKRCASPSPTSLTVNR